MKEWTCKKCVGAKFCVVTRPGNPNDTRYCPEKRGISDWECKDCDETHGTDYTSLEAWEAGDLPKEDGKGEATMVYKALGKTPESFRGGE